MRQLLLKLLLGKNIAVFVSEEGSNNYQIKIGDIRKRKQLLVCQVEKVASTQYRVADL